MMLVPRPSFALLFSFLIPVLAQAAATISWRDNSSNEQGFIVERAVGTASFRQIAVVGANVTSFSDRNLVDGMLHRYRVCAYNNAGRSAFSNTVNHDLSVVLPLPDIAAIPDLVLAVDEPATVQVPVTQIDLRATGVKLVASSSDPLVVPNPRVEAGSSAVRLSIRPASGRAGKVMITLVVSNGQRIAYERFKVTVGTASTAGSIMVTPPPARPKVRNLSARAWVGQGAEALLVGFALQQDDAKLLLRGVGPGLVPYVESSALELPLLTLYSGGTRLARNSEWGGTSELIRAMSEAGAFPLARNSRDTALLRILPPGDYSAEVAAAGEPGFGLAELYQLEKDGADGVLVNLSARASVEEAADLVIGFTLYGEGKQKLLIRAAGPSLQKYGVSKTVSDPRIVFYRGETRVLAADGIPLTPELIEASFATGAFPLTYTKEVAFLVTLAPGVYTAVVSSVDGRTGVSLGEIYAVP